MKATWKLADGNQSCTTCHVYIDKNWFDRVGKPDPFEDDKLDMAIVGIGVTPNVELAKTADIQTKNGIIVDEYCRTNQDNIFAIGDCVCLPFNNMSTRLESVQNAHDQGANAALNISGIKTKYKPYPWFWSDQFNVKLQIAGLNRGYDDVTIKQGKRDGSVSHYYFKNGALIAVDSLNDPATYAMVRKALEAHMTISQAQVEQDGLTFAMQSKLTLRAN